MKADQLGNVHDQAAFGRVDELEVFLGGGLQPLPTWAGVDPVKPDGIRLKAVSERVSMGCAV